MRWPVARPTCACGPWPCSGRAIFAIIDTQCSVSLEIHGTRGTVARTMRAPRGRRAPALGALFRSWILDHAHALASVVLVVTWRQDGESPTRGLVSLGGAPAHRGTRRDWEALLRISLWAWWRCTRVALWVRPTAAGEHEPLWSTIIRTWWSAVIRWVCRSIRAAPGTVAAATEPTAAEQCHAERHERQCSLEELPDSVPVASRCISRMASISIASGVRAI